MAQDIETLKLAVVVGNFPVVSESFILRMLERLSRESVAITIIVMGGYREDFLRELSPELSLRLQEGVVKVIYKAMPKIAHIARLWRYITPFFGLFYKPVACVRIIFRHRIRLKVLLRSLYFLDLVKRMDNCDLVHAQYLNLGIAAGIAREICNELDWTLLASIRGADISKHNVISRREMEWLRFSSLAPNGYLAVSKSLKNYAVYRGLPPSDISIHRSGLDTELIRFVPNERASQREDIVKIIQVGRMVHKKGFNLTVAVVSKLSGVFNCEVTFVGDGPEREKLKKMAVELGVHEKILFAGALKHTETLERIAKSDVLVVPSLSGTDGDIEGIPNVIKEAMALGVIVVSSDHSGAKELVVDGLTGFVFSENCQQAYFDSLNLALSCRENWLAMQVSAREKVVSEYDISLTTRNLVAFYGEKVARRD
jgi:colanic acid/amylovoran biosynthesis glycosyltransferase